jgi:hypothetical protein
MKENVETAVILFQNYLVMGAKKFVVVYSLKNAKQSENGSDVITEEYDLDDIKKEIERKTNQKYPSLMKKLKEKIIKLS